MIKFLGSGFFQYGVVPVLSVALSVYIRFASRRDQDRSWRKEDAAVGLDLMLVAVLAVLTTVAARAVALANANEAALVAANTGVMGAALAHLQSEVDRATTALVDAGVLLFVQLVTLWGSSFMIQQWGWLERDNLRPVIGLGIPIALGLMSILVTIRIAS